MMTPRPFMYWHGTLTGCYADSWAPPSSQLFVVDLPVGPIISPPMLFVMEPVTPQQMAPPVRRKTKPVVIAHPAAWGARGAHMLAQAYRPEGL